jgi:hypothetical protein
VPEPFDPRLGLTGGEDTLFIRQLLRGGRKIVWCAEAVIWETIPSEKLEARYLLRRAFRPKPHLLPARVQRRLRPLPKLPLPQQPEEMPKKGKPFLVIWAVPDAMVIKVREIQRHH